MVFISSGTDEVRAKREPSLCNESVKRQYWSNLAKNCMRLGLPNLPPLKLKPFFHFLLTNQCMRWLPNLPPLLSSLPQVLISLSVDQSLYDMGYLVCHHWSSRYSFTFYWPISVWDGYQICHHWSSLPQALISLSVNQSLYDMGYQGYLVCHHF